VRAASRMPSPPRTQAVPREALPDALPDALAGPSVLHMLEQLRIGYDPEEDRLVLQIRTDDPASAEGHTLALTRRVWLQARQNLGAMIEASAEPPARLAAPQRQAVAAIHHQALAATVPMRSEPPKDKLAGMPHELVLSMRCGRRRSDRRWVLGFGLRGKPDLSLVLNDRTMHALVNALFKRESSLQWGLPPIKALDQAGAPGPRPTELH
jgi:hypothetical protein